MKLSSLLFEGEYISQTDAQKIDISKICTDSRKVRHGDVFVCLAGEHFDSHICAEEALRRGAVAIVANRAAKISVPKGAPVFLVESTHRALSLMCSRYYKFPEKYMKIIGVTGTNGKSSTVSLIAEILSNAGVKAGVIGTIDTQIDGRSLEISADEDELQRLKSMTTPSPLMLYKILDKMKESKVEYVIMEISSHALYYEKCAPISFYISVFTNISPEHLDFHPDMVSYAECKARLFSGARHAIINADTDYSHLMLMSADGNKISVSGYGKGDVTYSDVVSLGTYGSELIYESKNLRFPLRVGTPGIFSVQNAVMATAVCECIGISPVVIKDAIEHSRGVKGRLERVAIGEEYKFSVFIDYAHTPQAMENLMRAVSDFRRNEERMVVLFGCGGERDKSKRAPMGATASKYADYIIVTSDNTRGEDADTIISDILSGIPEEAEKTVITDRRAAIRYAVKNARENDIILLVGKGHESYEIDKNGYRDFSERDIVTETLKELKSQG